jgi:hypothetical protein
MCSPLLSWRCLQNACEKTFSSSITLSYQSNDKQEQLKMEEMFCMCLISWLTSLLGKLDPGGSRVVVARHGSCML